MTLAAIADRARSWLVDAAAPLWWQRGVERDEGGFVERIGQNGAPIREIRRVRVSARQVYAFALAARLGWTGPVEAAVRHGLDFLRGPGRGPHGLLTHRLAPGGGVAAAGPDLYDQAFLLLALAEARRVLDEPALEREALAVLARLDATMRHPAIGYEEGPERGLGLRANPHMHLLEAALAWMAAGRDPAWHALGAEMVALCRRHLVDPATGALLEHFDAGWRPLDGAGGDSVEPGHLFEWSWLLWRWGRASGDPADGLALRFAALGRRHGLDPARGVAIDELDRALAPKRATARLWPQTERLKAGIATLALAPDAAARAEAEAEIAAAWAALERYLATPLPGLWYDRMDDTGAIADEPAPASTFYHLAGAAAELAEAAGGTRAADQAAPRAEATWSRNHA